MLLEVSSSSGVAQEAAAVPLPGLSSLLPGVPRKALKQCHQFYFRERSKLYVLHVLIFGYFLLLVPIV